VYTIVPVEDLDYGLTLLRELQNQRLVGVELEVEV
jgi:hypothetical protein